jgi:site-specific DNA-methyltransferase (adenine-specific)
MADDLVEAGPPDGGAREVVTPRSVGAARQALAAMERDVDSAKTYVEIRKLERQAEALKALFREYDAVRQDAERVILVARHRIGAELKAQPTNAGGRPAKTAPLSGGVSEAGSQQRQWRLKQLAEHGRDQLLNAASTLWQAGKEATQTAVLKLIAGEETKARREASRSAQPLPDGMELRIGDCRAVLADVPDNSTPLIFTDPPHHREGEPLYRWLAEFAARALIPGGSLIVYTGHWSLNRDMAIFDQRLRYWWLLAMMHDHGVQSFPGKFVIIGFRPVLWYVKEFRRGRTLVPDVLRSPKPDKVIHEWSKGEGGAGQLIEHLTEPGELIVDPFAGSAQWGRLAASMGRRWLGADVILGGDAVIQASDSDD